MHRLLPSLRASRRSGQPLRAVRRHARARARAPGRAGAPAAARAHLGHRVRSARGAPAPATAPFPVPLPRTAARSQGHERRGMGDQRESRAGGRRAAPPAHLSEAAPHMSLRSLSVTLGPFATNAYVVTCEETLETAVLDVGFDAAEMARRLKAAGFHVRYLLNTHAHYDHIA